MCSNHDGDITLVIMILIIKSVKPGIQNIAYTSNFLLTFSIEYASKSNLTIFKLPGHGRNFQEGVL